MNADTTRREYQLSEGDYDRIVEASRSRPVIFPGGGSYNAQQHNANDAWEIIGAKMGFKAHTVMPVIGKSARWFSACPKEYV